MENPAERLRLNKAEVGSIELSSYLNDNFYIIKFRDDGRGLESARLREKAIQSGKWEMNQLNSWKANEYIDALLDIGSSDEDSMEMKDNFANICAIKRKISRLKGNIELEFDEGKYCEFTIRIPLTENKNSVEKNK
jgi:two-component system chemotaxis sensor kinase CheA